MASRTVLLLLVFSVAVRLADKCDALMLALVSVLNSGAEIECRLTCLKLRISLLELYTR